jgi:selenocysteine-specific elongation factor
VALPVFKTGVARYPGQAGSIPVRLRHVGAGAEERPVHVVATAGHVDHGKSSLVRALTGMEPDRLADEQRRGLTIDLGFAWATLPSGARLAFVDVPGHERFVPTMLAGVGPVPAVVLVVAADGGWMPQSAEHLAVLHALGVEHGLLVITRSDLADPMLARGEAYAAMAGTSLRGVPCVEVSSVTGSGLPRLLDALDDLVSELPAPDPTAPVRLWIDRSFSIRGSGTVVTGTLPTGRIRLGDELLHVPSGRLLRVRGLHSLGHRVETADGVARVAVNLRGVSRQEFARGHALLSPRKFLPTREIDVRLDTTPAEDPPPTAMFHIGSASVTAQIRPLSRQAWRLRLATYLPLRIGDRALLRDPGRHEVIGGLTVLDPQPPGLVRRGAAAARGQEIDALPSTPDPEAELRRRRIVRRGDLAAMGVTPPAGPAVGDWLMDPAHARSLGDQLRSEVEAYVRGHPLDSGMPVELLRQRLALPDRALVGILVRPPLAVLDGRVVVGDGGIRLPPRVSEAVDTVRRELAAAPFAAPDSARLAELGLGRREISAAARAGRLLRVTDGVVLLPGADRDAVRALAALPQPFTLSEARRALGTSRRVAVPLLELLDRRGLTERRPDDTRVLRS